MCDNRIANVFNMMKYFRCNICFHFFLQRRGEPSPFLHLHLPYTATPQFQPYSSLQYEVLGPVVVLLALARHPSYTTSPGWNNRTFINTPSHLPHQAESSPTHSTTATMPPALPNPEEDAYNSASDSDFDASLSPSSGDESEASDAAIAPKSGKRKIDADGDVDMASGDEGIVAQGRNKKRRKGKGKGEGKEKAGDGDGGIVEEGKDEDGEGEWGVGIRVRLRSGRGG